MLKRQDQLPLPTFFKIVSILLSAQAHHLWGGGHLGPLPPLSLPKVIFIPSTLPSLSCLGPEAQAAGWHCGSSFLVPSQQTLSTSLPPGG